MTRRRLLAVSALAAVMAASAGACSATDPPGRGPIFGDKPLPDATLGGEDAADAGEDGASTSDAPEDVVSDRAITDAREGG